MAIGDYLFDKKVVEPVLDEVKEQRGEDVDEVDDTQQLIATGQLDEVEPSTLTNNIAIEKDLEPLDEYLDDNEVEPLEEQE